MATLEDAAEGLVVKLKALDSEIEESERSITDLRTRVEETESEVEHEWTALAEAVHAFLEKVQTESQALDTQVTETLQGVGEAQQAVAQDGEQARTEIDQGRAQLDSLGQHATGLEPGVESLASEAGEAPAKGLAERAHELQQELQKTVEDARTFLEDEVAPAVEKVATDIRERCEELHKELAEEMTQALQHAFDEWEPKVDELEEYVASKGFQASHQHAHDMVEYVVEECETLCTQKLDELHQLVGVLVTQLQELAHGVEESARTLVAEAGHHLSEELEHAHHSATTAVSALDKVRDAMVERKFMEA